VKSLLDECLPLDLRLSFLSNEAHTAQWAGMKGRKNGELLQSAELAGHDVLLTVDEAMPRQPNPVGRNLAIVLLRARTNRLEDLLPLVDSILQAIEKIQPGQTVVVAACD
jgi:predicted nuclease of predicted toxin-antitoxin system